MSIQRNGSVASRKGPAETFVGSVRIDGSFEVAAPGRMSGATVTFEPGARSAWHRHPLGQTLIVQSGLGWTQNEGEPVQEIRPGDIVTCPPGVKHWHGATATTSMSHVAIVESLDGTGVEWLEPVTDEQFLAGADSVHD